MAGNNRPALARSRLVRSKVDGIRRREPENKTLMTGPRGAEALPVLPGQSWSSGNERRAYQLHVGLNRLFGFLNGRSAFKSRPDAFV